MCIHFSVLQTLLKPYMKGALKMDRMQNNKGTPSKDTGSKNRINLDYDFNTEYGDGDIPNIDKPNYSNATPKIPVEMPIREDK